MEVKGELKLKVEHLTLSFGSLQALMDVSFEVYGDEILALIGPVKVVDAVRPTPVLGAGGIADGRALAAASTLGAEEFGLELHLLLLKRLTLMLLKKGAYMLMLSGIMYGNKNY